MTIYTDYISLEIQQHLTKCAESPELKHHFYPTPVEPIVETVGKVCYGRSNYVSGPLIKTVYVEDTFGTHYKVSVENLMPVKGHGWITHSEADELDVHYDKDLKVYVKTTPEYKAWLTETRASLGHVDSNGQVSFNF